MSDLVGNVDSLLRKMLRCIIFLYATGACIITTGQNCLRVLPMSVHSAMAMFTFEFRGDVFDYACESSLSLFVFFYFHWHEFSHVCGSVTFFFCRMD